MPKVRGLVPFVGSALFLACAVGLFGFANSTNPIDVLLGRGRLITAPDVLERALPAAEVEVERVGFVTEVRRDFSISVPRGAVMAQDPKPGERARAGDTIVLTVSRGVNRVAMPDAVGKAFSKIKVPLDKAGISIKVTKVPSETVPKGVVLSQNPDPGVIVAGTDVAAFEVSSGPERRTVPEVAGLTGEGAAALLGSEGLTLGEVAPVDDPTIPTGAVQSISPPAGTVVPKGTAVDLAISAGPAPVPVPSLTGSQVDAATDALKSAGFRADLARRLLPYGDRTDGKVLEQNPAADELLRPGQAVTIVVGRAVGPPITTTTTTTTTATTTTTTVPPATSTTGAPSSSPGGD